MPSQSIPIQNIYYLLAYAWDHFRGGDEINVDQSRCPDVHNLLALLLTGGIRRLATRAIDKSYKLYEEETPRLRGRLQILRSHQKLTYVSGTMFCEFDELTADTLPNQILKATCRRLLLCSTQLTVENRRQVRCASGLLSDISDIRISGRDFYRIQLHRNNRHYRLLIHLCHLLHELFLPEERTGDRRFRDMLDEDTIMHRVFESFVLHFAKRHCQPAHVSAMALKWDGHWDEDVDEVLPRMMTDVTIDRPGRKTIVDCKFYRDALVTRHDRHRLHSPHLYQLIAYLRNKSIEESWRAVEGILLYPAVDHHLKLKFELIGHNIEIHSIDLDLPWPEIHNQLISILN